MNIEQQARDLLARAGVEDAESFSAGEVSEIAELIHENIRLRNLLNRCVPFVQTVYLDTEAKHDDSNGDYYMDFGQYEIMEVIGSLLTEIENTI